MEKCRGFTKVELLVAFACLLILVGLLMPAVGSRREFATRTMCVANGRAGQSVSDG